MARFTTSQRHLGAAVILGVIAGVAMRRLLYPPRAQTRREGPISAIDWGSARRVAMRVAGADAAVPIRELPRLEELYQRLAARSELLVAEYLGAPLPAPVMAIQVLNRVQWLAVNLAEFEALLGPLAERRAQREIAEGKSGGSPWSDLGPRWTGGSLGVLIGYMARHVLGQHDLHLLSGAQSGRGALYVVEPNIRRVAWRLDLDPDDLRLWVVLHEMTHVFQFELHPWLRAHLRDLILQFLAASEAEMNAGGEFGRVVSRAIRSWSTGEHWIQAMQSPKQRHLFDRLQALMSVIEGHANHVTSAVGRNLLSTFDTIEARMAARREMRPLLERLLNHLTGLDLKLEQYHQGQEFVDAVVKARGVEFADRMWAGADFLPTIDEIRDPGRWMQRAEQVA